MDELFDTANENTDKKPVEQNKAEKDISEKVLYAEMKISEVPENAVKNNVKRTILTAALLFLVPFCAALIFAVIAKRISPAHIQQREGLAAEAATVIPPAPADSAGVSELLEYRTALRKIGSPVNYADIRLWAAAGREPSSLFKVASPGSGSWKWCVSQCGEYALAIEANEELFKEVALYSFRTEKWVWRQRLPWPDKYEDPWIFNGHLILRSIKNNRRFAMELNDSGRIISLDELKGGKFIRNIPELPEGIIGEPVALRSKVFFSSDRDTGALTGYAVDRLPGLYSIGLLPENACISGNGLLKFTASNGILFAWDAFAGQMLAMQNAWNQSTNTVVKGMEASRDGSTVTVHLESSFNFDKPLIRNWCVTWNPAEEAMRTNMTNAPAFTPPDITTEIESTGITLSLKSDNILEVCTNGSNQAVATIDLARYIPCGNDPVKSINLLEDERFVLIRQREKAHLLDLSTVKHYAGLLDKIEHCNKILTEYSDEQLSRTNIAGNAMRELQGEDRSSESDDNFNYEMTEYDMYFMSPSQLEPPTKPSILSLQAEFLAVHHAWLYAADKLEQLMAIQEQDHRAPKANSLLFTRYSLLSGNKKRAKKGCENGLRYLFYDNSDYNKMIRWQILRILFE